MILRRMGLDFTYTFFGLPLAVVGFGLLVTLFAASLGTAVIFVGIPLLALTLLFARGFADIERARLHRLTGGPTIRPHYARAPEGAGWFRRMTAPIVQVQSWLDLLYAVLVLPIAIIAFVLPIVWWAATLGGLTYWFWGGFIPRGRVATSSSRRSWARTPSRTERSSTRSSAWWHCSPCTSSSAGAPPCRPVSRGRCSLP